MFRPNGKEQVVMEWTDAYVLELHEQLRLRGAYIGQLTLRAALTAAAEAQGLTPIPQESQPVERRCATCDFWRERPKEPGYGDCRRYPPRLSVAYDADGRGPTWIEQHRPSTQADDFCGEYAKDPTP